MISTAPTRPLRRRVVVVAASTLAVGTISAVAPTPAILSASAATTTAVTTAGQVAATGTVSAVEASVAAPTVRTAPTTTRTTTTRTATSTRAATVAPFRFATVSYNQWWAKRLMVTRYHWKSTAQFRCLVRLWNFESHWNHRAHNSRSGAHGIPQALPGSKMRSAGSDWRTNPVTQIAWGLSYVKKRYSTPCGALAHFYRHRWY